VDIRDDFNGTSGNFGLDGESLEKRSLFGSETGVLAGDDDVDGGDGSGTSRGGDFVVEEHVATSRRSPLVNTNPTFGPNEEELSRNREIHQ